MTGQRDLLGRTVRLRSWRPDDVGAVLAACQDPEIQRWTEVPVPYRHEHAGFVAEGVLRQRSIHRGVPVDDVIYGLLAMDPRPPV